MWVRKIIKVGDSFAITLPAEYCRHMDIMGFEYFAIQVGEDDSLLVTEVDLNKRPDLKQLSDEGLPIME